MSGYQGLEPLIHATMAELERLKRPAEPEQLG